MSTGQKQRPGIFLIPDLVAGKIVKFISNIDIVQTLNFLVAGKIVKFISNIDIVQTLNFLVAGKMRDHVCRCGIGFACRHC